MNKKERLRKVRLYEQFLLRFFIFALAIMILINIYLIQKVPACIQEEVKQAPLEEENISNALYNHSELTELKTNLDTLNYLIFRTQGESMEPIIKGNSKCVCLKKSAYEEGDIAVFFMNTSKGWQGIAHQIINISAGEITTKGANNNFTDVPFKQENILCYVPKVWRYQIIQEKIKLLNLSDFFI